MLTDPGTHPDFKPKLKSNEDLYEILGISQHHFLRRAEIIRNLKPLIRTLTEDKTFKKNDENESLPSKKILLKLKRTGKLVKKMKEKGSLRRHFPFGNVPFFQQKYN